MKLHFEQYGNPNNPPLLILHGFMASSRNWRQIAIQLSNEFNVFTVDLRNHGSSPHSEQMSYSNMVQDIVQFLEERNLEFASILGHSMGGKVAMWFALQFPEKIGQLIVVDISPIAYSHSFTGLLKALRQIPLDHISSRKDADSFLQDNVTDIRLRQFLLQNLILVEGKYQWRVDLDILIENDQNITGFPNCDQTAPFLAKSLFVSGQNSNYIEVEPTLKLFPNAEFEIIEDAGHWLHAEKPKHFVSTCLNYLNNYQAPST